MTDQNETNQDRAALDCQAQNWVRRIALGEASKADAEALQCWCSRSPAHAAAFSEASQLWRAFGEAGQNLRQQVSSPPAHAGLSRRVLIGGALAASAAGVAMLRPPLGAWPSLFELQADFRTATGEQRQVVAGDGVAVQMNTRTSLALAKDARDRGAVELIAGEASFHVSRLQYGTYRVIAGDGRTSANNARFDIRLSGSLACVTCLANEVEVEHRNETARLQPNQQVKYDDRGLRPVVVVDPAIVSAWQQGLIICSMTPLSDVIDELNRYRPGHIVLLNSELRHSPVNGRFRIDDPDEALAQIERAFAVRARTLPGGVILLT